MKHGDVFKINSDEQLYFADTVTPSGSVFARKFDLDKGAYDQPMSFQSSSITETLFNTFEPEQDDGWEYCTIVQKLFPEQGYPSKEWLEAEAEGRSGVYSAGKSQVIGVLQGDPRLGHKNEKHELILKELVNELTKSGWKIVLQRKHKWYGLRFKRKL
ncbi:MAG TPA: hypothetical protein PLD25_28355 [Chloroflexota bacterium]|nr:hypothetical protein [Chloroflexota bacterium]HUM70157.1 hypothetical protein [Chloroflexota bacterium]